MSDQPSQAAQSSSPAVGDRVRHATSGWAGVVIEVRPDDSGMDGSQGPLVTVRPDHPRPKEVWDRNSHNFIPTPADWAGWAPLTVTAAELERTT